MKTILFILFALSASLYAATDQLGVGVMVGNPTGLNGKYWLGGNRAVDGGLAYSIGRHSDLSLHSDYLLHKNSAFYFNDDVPLDLYYGVGGRMEFADDIEVGVRIPVGLAHRFSEESADIFGEIAPIVDLIPKTGIELHIAIGARYYFK